MGVDAAAAARSPTRAWSCFCDCSRATLSTSTGGESTSRPPPSTAGGPRILIAGGSAAAAKRAGRHGLGFIAFTNTPELKETFESESRAHGHEPGPAQFPDGRSPTAVFVAEDVDAAWAEIGSYLLHDARMAAAYRQGDESVASITRADTVDELRSAQGPYVVMTIDDAVAQIRSGASLQLHPSVRGHAAGYCVALPRTCVGGRLAGEGRRIAENPSCSADSAVLIS